MMIRYTLKCRDDHRFESWFRSAEAYEALRGAGEVTCPVCGSGAVEKALMAPAIARPTRAEGGAAAGASEGPLSGPRSPVEAALAEMRRQIEQNSEYVGLNFAAEARAIHDGDAPERAIYGEAKAEEARRLLEDGIPVAPLPFLPPRKAN